MAKLSVSTLRKLGLCEDHFPVTSFTNGAKVRLTRNAVPVAYKNADLSISEENVETERRIETQGQTIAALSSNNENMVMEEQVSHLKKDAALITYENVDSSVNEENIDVERHAEMQKNITAALLPNDENIISKEQMSEEHALRTYRPSVLNFEMSAEEEDIMYIEMLNIITQNDDMLRANIIALKEIMLQKIIQIKRSKY